MSRRVVIGLAVSAFVNASLYAALGLRLRAQQTQFVELLSRHRSSTAGGFVANRVIETLAAVAGLVVAICAARVRRSSTRSFVVAAELAAVAISMVGLQITPSRFLPSTVTPVALWQQRLGEGAVLLFLAALASFAATAALTTHLRRIAKKGKGRRR